MALRRPPCTRLHLLVAAMVLCSSASLAHGQALTQVGTVTATVDQLMSLPFTPGPVLSAGQGVYVKVTSTGASIVTSGCTNNAACATATTNATFTVSVNTLGLGSGVALTTVNVCTLVTDAAGLDSLNSKLPTATQPIDCYGSALAAVSSSSKLISLSGSVDLLATTAGNTFSNYGIIPQGSIANYSAGGLYFVVFNAGTPTSVKPQFQVTAMRIQATPGSSMTPPPPPALSPAQSPGHAAANRPSYLVGALALLAALMCLRM